MATVNLLNSSWATNQTQGNVNITTSDSSVTFRIGTSATPKTGWAKACISIDASKYSSITLSYSKIQDDGITDLYFGVYNSISADQSDPVSYTSGSSTYTLLTSSFNRSSGGTITFDIPSSVSGIKYVGFHFYGNSDKTIYGSSEYVYITSLTAVEKKSYTVTYDANGGSGTTRSQTVVAGSAVTLSSNNFTAPTSPARILTLDGNGGNDGSPIFKGNFFSKWREGSTSGWPHYPGNAYTPREDTTMYAWWATKYIFGTTTRESDTSNGYTVTFNANGGTCDTSSLTSIITTSYDFFGWGDLADEPTTTYTSSSVYYIYDETTVYAIWSPTITDGSIPLPTPTRNGYKFLGWSTDKYDTGGITGEYTPHEDGITLYAIWTPMGLVYINDGEFSPYQVWIYDSSGWNQYIPYIYTESGWEIFSG